MVGLNLISMMPPSLRRIFRATYNVSANGPYFSVDINNYNGSLYFGNAEGFVEMGGYGIYNGGSHEAFISESGSRTIVDQRLNAIIPRRPAT